MDVTKLLIIGTGGFAGSVCRYIISLATNRYFDTPVFPYGTLTVNVVGCFFIGLFGGLSETRQFFTPEIRALILIGFLGGFTTYSTFGYEVVTLFKQGQTGVVFINLFLHLILGFGAVFCGLSISKLV